jgi:hypothetical protein
MVLQHAKQERLLIGVVLIQRSYGYPGALRNTRRRQTVRPVAEQNLNSRLENRVHRDGRPRLNRRLSWLKRL